LWYHVGDMIKATQPQDTSPKASVPRFCSRPIRKLRAVVAVLLAALALTLVVGGMTVSATIILPETVSYNAAIADIVSRVTTPTLVYELAGLTGERPVVVAGSPYTIATRHSDQTQAISMATRYAYEQFEGFGLVVTYHNYPYGDHHLRNVIAEKPGVVDPNEVLLITAHMDSRPSGPLAPGADDNGSGSVAVLMAAKLLAPYHFTHTIRFVLFTGEEQGLLGSAAYAADRKALGEEIRGVVNLDMIGYNSDEQPIIDLYAHSNITDSLTLTRVFSDVVGLYDLNLIPDRFDSTEDRPIESSDQWSFLRQGYPAFLAIEDMDDFTPYYHKVTDRLFTLNLDYYADFTRAAIATIAHLGQLRPTGQLSGTVSALDTGHPLLATVDVVMSSLDYTFTTSTGPDGVYSLFLPFGSYTLTVGTPAQPYYPATITDVVILTNTITVQDIRLQPHLRVYLPLILLNREMSGTWAP
jgi:hypothetical protein